MEGMSKMDSIDYATKLQKEFGVDQSDAIKMLDQESDDMRGDNFRPGTRLRYPEALISAYDHIREWLTTGNEYAVKLDWDSLAQFAGSHRRACVWAVFSCKARSKAVQG